MLGVPLDLGDERQVRIMKRRNLVNLDRLNYEWDHDIAWVYPKVHDLERLGPVKRLAGSVGGADDDTE